MKPKAIIADPNKLANAGVNTTRQAAILIHLGRCGLLGSTIPAISDALGIKVGTAANGIDVLLEAKLVTATRRSTGQGRAKHYVCTVHGWSVLTDPSDFSMFPHAQTALKKV